MNGDDGGMREFADDAGFAEETGAGLSTGKLRGKEFDGDRTVDERVIGADHTAVSASAESFVDLISSDLHGW